ncbi:MAG: hypothetical protein ACFFE8_15010 [Candidatus Heimdallarchaeota archaeon]
MSLQNENQADDLNFERELSRYWFCPNDRNTLQLHHTKQSQNPYFTVNKQNLDIGIENAIALKKIAPEAKKQAYELVHFIFDMDPTKQNVDLVGVHCTVCGAQFAAPKVMKIIDGDFSKDRARAIFESTRALETKYFGPFRVVDHFGIARYARDEQGTSRSSFFWLWILGFRTILMMAFLYYILGLELKLGTRWVPLGLILFIGGLVGIIFIGFYFDIFGILGGILVRIPWSLEVLFPIR